MIQDLNLKNWVVGSSQKILHRIHDDDVNIAILNRNTQSFFEEIKLVLDAAINIHINGSSSLIIKTIEQKLSKYHYINKDIISILLHFKEVTKATNFKLALSCVTTNMCTKFHTDVNTIRLLCTYSGPGTLWLTEDNINRNALKAKEHNHCIVINKTNIQQVKTGAVVLLKGDKYSKEAQGVVHKSPYIVEKNTKRLLLRIDTNEFLNF